MWLQRSSGSRMGTRLNRHRNVHRRLLERSEERTPSSKGPHLLAKSLKVAFWAHGTVGSFRRRGEVQGQVLLLGEADEFPVVGEVAAGALAGALDGDLAGVPEAGRHLV